MFNKTGYVTKLSTINMWLLHIVFIHSR